LDITFILDISIGIHQDGRARKKKMSFNKVDRVSVGILLVLVVSSVSAAGSYPLFQLIFSFDFLEQLFVFGSYLKDTAKWSSVVRALSELMDVSNDHVLSRAMCG
jgi:hypothetical protein